MLRVMDAIPVLRQGNVWTTSAQQTVEWHHPPGRPFASVRTRPPQQDYPPNLRLPRCLEENKAFAADPRVGAFGISCHESGRVAIVLVEVGHKAFSIAPVNNAGNSRLQWTSATIPSWLFWCQAVFSRVPVSTMLLFPPTRMEVSSSWLLFPSAQWHF